jgi:Fe2+ transport system protein B
MWREQVSNSKTDKQKRINEIDKTIEMMITNLNEIVMSELQKEMKDHPEESETEVKEKVVKKLKEREDDNIIVENIASLLEQRNRLTGVKKDKTFDEMLKNITPTILSILASIFLFTILILLFVGNVHQDLRDILNIFIGSALSIVATTFSYWFGHKEKDYKKDEKDEKNS